MKHKHEYEAGKSKKVALCKCGRFKHINLKPEDIITEQTSTPWYLVANTPGVDIRHKFNGQELTLIENVNYQVANEVIRAINSREALVAAAKYAVCSDTCPHNKCQGLREAILKAEGE